MLRSVETEYSNYRLHKGRSQLFGSLAAKEEWAGNVTTREGGAESVKGRL